MSKAAGRLLRGSIAADQFRLFAADTSAIVQRARDLHDLYPLPTILMGRLISAVALMSGELKAPNSEISLRIDAEGPLRGAIAIADMAGDIKAYAFEPQLWMEEPSANLQVGKHLLPGTLSVIRQIGMKSPYTGQIKLIDGEIASDVAAYYEQSEQTATAVNLGVLMDPNAAIRSAGGVLIQQMPNADPALAEIISSNLQNTPNVSDLMDMGLSIEDILERFILKDLSWKIVKETTLRYHCDCSRERFARALLLLGKNELMSMREGIAPLCNYCNKSYHFDAEDIDNLIEALDKQYEKQ
ncbi:MAG: Hsp33 family molecular chaperone HslO [Candidatus Cloacimonadales bacterium]|jgi:molecular chaperone Hsp33|nr:Hsp33 family molecular chaperone HslO [Candidatus Cloacimonadota bacterium]MDY0380640.1 Hsp33 family molecular chaperone HslO [Candidatus Cloacimonadaceae bacterium]MCB5256861.1 Hsp33 family molecular chaperone HslO [Candidatus Cloacimonadota bacterium]MCB5263754.1 Hsp33 family molecular chaperone HslO [Candidatus Cloacimonadota bacterium]MCB5276408.1 Hsp33 family molecular chaperone HslO [Candidatus Cloacimonadota bacterium]